jgi:hypothetical protein
MSAAHGDFDLLALFDFAKHAAQARLQLSNADFKHVVILSRK